MADTTQATRSADFHIRLPCQPRSVVEARARVREWARKARTPRDLVADILLAVSEAATNAVRHSRCDEFEVEGWIRRARLVVSVVDHGPGGGGANPGLGVGLKVIDALAESVEIEHTNPGTRVTMRFARRARP